MFQTVVTIYLKIRMLIVCNHNESFMNFKYFFIDNDSDMNKNIFVLYIDKLSCEHNGIELS